MTARMIVLAVILCIVIFAVLGIWRIKNKVTKFSRDLFGTDSLVEGINRQADIAAETPKSVSGMTRLMEPQIMRDFPDFSWEEFKHRAENMLTSALLAITNGDVTTIQNASDAVKDQIRNRIEDNEAAGIREVYEQIKIHQTEISNYHKEKGACVITIQSAVEYFYSKVRDGEVIGGSKERKTQTKYNTELIYIQDSDIAEFGNALGMTCPNCGAPIKSLGDMHCEYCGTKVTPVNTKVWSLHKIYEVGSQRL